MQKGETNLLGKYAATSYEEFWALCIETVFERPLPFRDQLPELHEGPCRLLNQGTSIKKKVLDLTMSD